ncbi:MAG TPA: orotate phosphoribosyltransferase [Flavobacteriales bacterium]|nr:orotate phosphoribosyltransferase [Flavobacteriales bacterium]
MNLVDDSALKVAEFLLQAKAIKLSPSQPFTWASGLKSPIYCDNRITLSYPQIRTYIRQQFVRHIEERFGRPDVIVGVATGGIAHGVLVAQEMGLPFAYVRSEAKSHGMQNLIEGHIEKGQSVVVIEDLVSTGKSSLSAVKALKAHECKINGMVAIFTYQFDEAVKAFEDAKVPLVTLTNYHVLIEQALEEEYISKKDVESLKKWRENPKDWSDKHA